MQTVVVNQNFFKSISWSASSSVKSISRSASSSIKSISRSASSSIKSISWSASSSVQSISWSALSHFKYGLPLAGCASFSSSRSNRLIVLCISAMFLRPGPLIPLTQLSPTATALDWPQHYQRLCLFLACQGYHLYKVAETSVPMKYHTDLIALGCPDKETFAMQKEIAFALLLHSVTPSLQFSKLVEDAGSYALAIIAIVAYVAASAQLSIAELKRRMKLIQNQCYEKKWYSVQHKATNIHDPASSSLFASSSRIISLSSSSSSSEFASRPPRAPRTIATTNTTIDPPARALRPHHHHASSMHHHESSSSPLTLLLLKEKAPHSE